MVRFRARMRWRLARIVVVAAVLAPSVGWADEAQRAEALFDRGLQHMLAGRYDEACPLIADSQRIEPLPGTLFTLAECNAKAGRIATAVGLYSEYIAFYSTLSPEEQALQGARLQVSIDERAALVKDVPRVTLRLPATAPSGTVVTRDGSVLSADRLGRPLSVDPGNVVVTTQAPGGPSREHRVTVRRGEHVMVDLTVASPRSAGAVVDEDEPEAPPVGTSRSAPEERPAPPESSSAWPWIAGGLGVAGVAVGTVTGLMVFSKSAVVDQHCRGRRCDREGLDAAESGRTLATVSNVSFGVGALGLGLAVVLAFGGSESKTGRRSLGPYVAARGAGLQGTW